MSADAELRYVWRCELTQNPVGTDTVMIGSPPCQCRGCRGFDLESTIASLKEERDGAIELAQWSSVENNTIVNQVWALLGGPDDTREGGQNLVVRVKEVLAAASASNEALRVALEAARTEIIGRYIERYIDGEDSRPQLMEEAR